MKKSSPPPTPIFEEPDAKRLAEAVAFAAERHGLQARKGTRIPYTSHLLQVAGMVLENGGSLDETIAALLHDSVEDAGVKFDDIRARFGDNVKDIVRDCTDLLDGDGPETKGPWKERKERYLEHLKTALDSAVLVAACDKLHNLRSIVADLRLDGLKSMKRFNAPPDQQRWFFTRFEAITGPRVNPPLRDELRRVVREFCDLLDAAERI